MENNLSKSIVSIKKALKYQKNLDIIINLC